MKKILNAPAAYVDEMLEGLCAAHPDAYRLLGEDRRVIVRAAATSPGQYRVM